jgi:hypothetical protein
MPRRLSGTLRSSFALLGLWGPWSAIVYAQSEPPRWVITAGLTAIRVGERGGWGYGPEADVRRDFGPNWGLGLRIALPVAGGQLGTGGAAIDLGPTLIHATPRWELGLSTGATAFLVGDQSELVDGGLGLFAGGHATVWLTRQVGARAGTDVRFTPGGKGYPSVSGGIAIRF